MVHRFPRGRPQVGVIVSITSLTAIFLCAGGGGALAACDNPRIVSSLYPRGTLSYIETPGVDPGSGGSSVTESFHGNFWAFGHGDPRADRGNDSGTFAAIGDGGWIQTPPGYPATLHTEWSAAATIDGCIDRLPGPRCVAVLLSDQASGRGYVALVTAAATTLGHYSLVQPEGQPIVLAPLATPTVTDVVTIPAALTSATVAVDTVPDGLYLDSNCTGPPINGFKVYAMRTPRGSLAPTDLRRNIPDGWTLAVGGETATGEPWAQGTDAAVSSPCSADEDLHLAVSLVFDSGFETAHVSRPAPPIRCGSSFE